MGRTGGGGMRGKGRFCLRVRVWTSQARSFWPDAHRRTPMGTDAHRRPPMRIDGALGRVLASFGAEHAALTALRRVACVCMCVCVECAGVAGVVVCGADSGDDGQRKRCAAAAISRRPLPHGNLHPGAHASLDHRSRRHVPHLCVVFVRVRGGGGGWMGFRNSSIACLCSFCARAYVAHVLRMLALCMGDVPPAESMCMSTRHMVSIQLPQRIPPVCQCNVWASPTQPGDVCPRNVWTFARAMRGHGWHRLLHS
eukprot:357690-Chlamydomonas_euryale.AAC.2